MNTRGISLGRCLSEGWQVFEANMGVLLLAYFLCNILVSAAANLPAGSILAMFPLVGGMTLLFLGMQKGLKGDIGTLFAGFSSVENWVRWLGVGWLLFVYQLAVTVVAFAIGAVPIVAGILLLANHISIAGGVILIVIGVGFAVLASAYYQIRWIFVFFVAAEGATATDAIEASTRMTEGIRLELFWIAVVLGLISLAGVLACFVGVFFTGPLTQSAMSALYLDVKQMRTPQTAASP